MTNKKNTVVVGMSGGVDSSVSAAILLEQGFDVVGVYMDLHNCREGKDFSKESIKSAQKVCDKLKIELKVWDLSKDFTNIVVDEFLREYKEGKTPNPCVTCNKNIKFGKFFETAIKEGADFIATGHYAQVFKNKDEFELVRGIDEQKDQTYFLYNLTQEILSKTMFPVGGLEKTKVRELARKYKLPVAERGDSQDVCFIQDGDTNKFLKENISNEKGEIIDIDSQKVIGKHYGLVYYTIGQRKGIGIGSDEPYFVVGKDQEKNQVLVGKGHQHPELFQEKLTVDKFHWISDNKQNFPFTADVQIRYRQKTISATIQDSQTIKFQESVRAISPGQSAVIYNRDKCLGGGIIV